MTTTKNQKSKSPKNSKIHSYKISTKDLQSIFKTLPNITHFQLQKIRTKVPTKIYKKLQTLCPFIDKYTIKDLQKEATSFMQIATQLSNDAAFSNLVEEK
ncbi:hypothetical protein [Helicobacter sp. T3_23-1056]